MRSTLASAARRRASRDLRGRSAGLAGCIDRLPSGRLSSFPAKPPCQFLECGLQFAFLDLDLTESGFQGDAPDPLCLSRLGGLELILQTSDLLPDFRRWLLHSGRSFMLFPLRRISWRIVEVAEVGD